MNKGNILMLNVYLPYCCPENFDSYQAYLGELSATCDSQDAYAVYIVGDFNAGRSNRFWQSLTEFCSDNNFVISDESSSVARGGAGGARAPPIGL